MIARVAGCVDGRVSDDGCGAAKAGRVAREFTMNQAYPALLKREMTKMWPNSLLTDGIVQRKLNVRFIGGGSSVG